MGFVEFGNVDLIYFYFNAQFTSFGLARVEVGVIIHINLFFNDLIDKYELITLSVK